MKTRMLPFLAAGCVVVLAVIGLMALLSAATSPVRDTNVTFICGRNAAVSMAVHGSALLSMAAFRRSNCSADAARANIVIQCPAQGIGQYFGGTVPSGLDLQPIDDRMSIIE